MRAFISLYVEARNVFDVFGTHVFALDHADSLRNFFGNHAGIEGINIHFLDDVGLDDTITNIANGLERGSNLVELLINFTRGGLLDATPIFARIALGTTSLKAFSFLYQGNVNRCLEQSLTMLESPSCTLEGFKLSIQFYGRPDEESSNFPKRLADALPKIKLTHLDISCIRLNQLATVSQKQELMSGMQKNTELETFDLRLFERDRDLDFCNKINAFCTRNKALKAFDGIKKGKLAPGTLPLIIRTIEKPLVNRGKDDDNELPNDVAATASSTKATMIFEWIKANQNPSYNQELARKI